YYVLMLLFDHDAQPPSVGRDALFDEVPAFWSGARVGRIGIVQRRPDITSPNSTLLQSVFHEVIAENQSPARHAAPRFEGKATLPLSCARSLTPSDFPGDLQVGQAATGDTLQRERETPEVSQVTLVEREHALVQIAEQVERPDADVRPVEATLQ